jgi:hypothetical protein
MSHEEEFDKIIREKAEGHEYSFDQANWEKARGILDAQRSPVKRLGAYLWLPAVFVLTIAGIYVYKIGESEGNRSLASETAVTPAPATETMQNIPVLEKTQPEMERKGSNAISSGTAGKIPPLPGIMVRTIKSARQAEPKNEIIDPLPAEQPDNALSERGENSKYQSKTPISSDQEEVTNNPQDPVIAIAIVKQEKKQSDVTASPSSSDENSGLNINQQKGPEPGSILEQPEFVFLAPTSMQIPVSESNPEATTTIFHNPPTSPDYVARSKYKSHILDLEAGTLYNTGWSTASGQDGNGFNWYAGLNYGFYLSKKFCILSGLQLYNLGGMHQPFYSFTYKKYDFSSTSASTVIASENLLYAALPLQVEFAVNNRSRMGVGVNAAYLIRATNRVTVNTASGAEVAHNHLVYSTHADYNYALTASYSYRFCTRWVIRGEGFYGLTDLLKNNASSSNSESMRGMRLGIQFLIFDK